MENKVTLKIDTEYDLLKDFRIACLNTLIDTEPDGEIRVILEDMKDRIKER